MFRKAASSGHGTWGCVHPAALTVQARARPAAPQTDQWAVTAATRPSPSPRLSQGHTSGSVRSATWRASACRSDSAVRLRAGRRCDGQPGPPPRLRPPWRRGAVSRTPTRAGGAPGRGGRAAASRRPRLSQAPHTAPPSEQTIDHIAPTPSAKCSKHAQLPSRWGEPTADAAWGCRGPRATHRPSGSEQPAPPSSVRLSPAAVAAPRRPGLAAGSRWRRTQP